MKIPKVILRIETSRVCGRGILLGISKYCRFFSHWRLSQQLPFYLLSSSSDGDPNLPENWMADGMIVARPEVPEYVRQMGIPIIGIDIQEPVPGIPNIVGDADLIAELALEHFVNRGFTKLAYCGFDGISWATKRGERFSYFAQKKGIDVTMYQMMDFRTRFSWDEELYKIAEWLGNLPYPIGMLACNDDCSKLISSACELAGIRVPDDVAILGVDNDEMLCLPNDPTLSSVVMDFEQAGFEAARLLDRIMKKEEKLGLQTIVLKPSHIVTRQSTDFFAVNDSDVAEALNFIKNHVNEPIGVPEVVESTSLSRRGLECRFKKVLGHSINKVITNFRVEQISKMLVETNFSISQIAHNLKFTGAEHISRYFCKVKKMSPSEFRKKYASSKQFSGETWFR